jgi:hypothetical protein
MWQAQTVRHVLLHCPNYEQQRVDLIRDAGSEDLQAILTHAASARAAARWFVRCGILEQFRTAHAINAEDIAEYAPWNRACLNLPLSFPFSFYIFNSELATGKVEAVV